MFKFSKVASAAATALLSTSFLLAYGVTTAASAQTQSSFEAPVIVAPAVATPVEPVQNSEQGANAAADEAPAASLAELVDEWQEGTMNEQVRCLATAVFYEARSEALAGQLAVAHVVIERARSGRFPASLCGVIKQRGQFGFVRNGRMPDQPNESEQWTTAKAIAQIALGEHWKNPAQGALYFHASRVAPGWGHERVAQIGNHVFYR
jgi:spore germination cell wall hydrolase CwlJ-like protein